MPQEAVEYARRGGKMPSLAKKKAPLRRPKRNPFYQSAEWKRARYDALVRHGTKLPVEMNSERSVLVFALILAMCMGSAAMAMRKLADADPAEIF